MANDLEDESGDAVRESAPSRAHGRSQPLAFDRALDPDPASATRPNLDTVQIQPQSGRWEVAGAVGSSIAAGAQGIREEVAAGAAAAGLVTRGMSSQIVRQEVREDIEEALEARGVSVDEDRLDGAVDAWMRLWQSGLRESEISERVFRQLLREAGEAP